MSAIELRTMIIIIEEIYKKLSTIDCFHKNKWTSSVVVVVVVVIGAFGLDFNASRVSVWLIRICWQFSSIGGSVRSSYEQMLVIKHGKLMETRIVASCGSMIFEKPYHANGFL